MIVFENFRIFKHHRVSSTNDVAFDLITGTNLPLVVVVAEEQTKGRGRAGHRWDSRPGGLYFSIAMPSRGLLEDSRLIVYSSLPVAEVLHDLGLTPRIKLPNDIYIGDKKISGILGERKSEYLIVGIGINVNQGEFPAEIPATSLFIETGKTFDRDDILYNFLHKFRILMESPESHFERWIRFVSALNKRVSFTYRNTKITGIVEHIDRELNLYVDGRKFNIYEIFGLTEP